MCSLNAKLAQRPGSLEMAEKGLLPLAPPMQTMLREGSISYPRVDDAVSDIEELEEDAFAAALAAPAAPVMSSPAPSIAPIPVPGLTVLPAPSPAPSEASTTSQPRRSRNHAKARKSGVAAGTSKVGNFVFHTYCPPPKSPVEPEVPVLQANRARQIQQEEYLRLQESEVKQNVLMQQLVQDIRARHESRPEARPSVLQTPAAAPFPSLAALNVQQLKEECKRYKVPRSGNKLNLIRNLEPFQKEILKKYVMSAQTSPTVSPAGGHVPVQAAQSEDQAMRHSSSAPQLNVTDLATTSPGSQWQQQQTALIVLNQAGQMTLQPATVLLQPSQVPPPPPPPPAPPSAPTVVLSDCAEEEGLVKKVEQLERMIVQNIQVSPRALLLVIPDISC